MSYTISYPALAKVDPKAAILVMFTNLEGFLKRSFKRNYPDERRPSNMAALTASLAEKGVIDSSLRAQLDDLRKRRNDVAHDDPNIGEEVALDYYGLLSVALVGLNRTSLFR
ncbi:hypothetical protein ACXDF8_26840 [Mycolicibacterium sp. CBM1]